MKPRFVTLDGKRYPWAEIVKARRAQSVEEPKQAPLFADLKIDSRPQAHKTARGRLEQPTLFDT